MLLLLPPTTPHKQVGEGEFGTVYKAQYLGTTVAVKVLKDDNAVAIGDFRWVGWLLTK